MTPEQQNIAANLEGTRTPEDLAENFRELNRIAPTPADRFKLMLSSMNDLPANLPPLPPVPEGFDRWEYRGMHWDSPDHCTHAVYYCDGEPWSVLSRCAHSGIYGESHYIEAVRDEPANYTGQCVLCGSLYEGTKAECKARKCADCIERETHLGCCAEIAGIDQPATGTEARACEGETPLTNAVAFDVYTNQGDGWVSREKCHDGDHVDADFARDLERKLAEARTALERIQSIPNEMDGGDWDEIEEARLIAEEALARIDAKGGTNDT